MVSSADNRDFIRAYVQESLDGALPLQEELEEMESVLFSVSFGRQEFHKKAGFQAFSAAISTQLHVGLVLRFLSRKQRVRESKCKVVAYRVAQRELGSTESEQEGLLTEGFEDGGEEGCGQKLLHLLQKMGVENILVVVCVWHHRMPG